MQTVEQLHPQAPYTSRQRGTQGQQHSIPLQNSNSLDTQTDCLLPPATQPLRRVFVEENDEFQLPCTPGYTLYQRKLYVL